ncbi:MAG: CocE/NonD family hydrolase [Actinomycetota bacterium]|nr:CocE/NonD family hydrolase [Actinomycetota bacterium]
MTSRRLITLAVTLALVAGAFIAPPARAQDGFDVVTKTYIAETRHGDVHVAVSHPARGDKIVPGPVVLTYTPYAVNGRSIASDLFPAADHVPDGYVRVVADVVGTGNSGGCWDYGGKGEKESAYDLVEWIAKQKWSTGKVAMIGGSYEGTTANMAAVARPPHLTTIVPVVAISRWYGYAYSGGIRYNLNNEFLGHKGPGAVTEEGLDTPLAFDFGLAIPPPIDPQNEDWAARVQSRINPCDRVAHTEHGYDFETPDYDEFWLERDYVKDAGKVTIPALVAHNYGDWNVKADEGWNMFHALDNSKHRVMFMGSRWAGHGAPGKPAPRTGGDETPSRAAFNKTVRMWFDHYLMGKDNGIDKLPSVITETADGSGEAKKLTYGAPKTRAIDLIVQQAPVTQPGLYQWQMLPSKPITFGFGPGGGENATAFPITNANLESHASHHGQSNHEWFWVESPLLKKDVRVFGEIKVQIYSKVAREWVTLTPGIFDVDPAKHIMAGSNHVGATDPAQVVAVTRGFLDSRYRNGLGKQVPVRPNRFFEATVPMKPIDYTFKEGHYIGLNIQTEIIEWMIPKVYPGCDAVPDAQGESGCAYIKIDWEDARTRVILPVVNGPKNAMSLFHPPGHVHESNCVLVDPVCGD